MKRENVMGFTTQTFLFLFFPACVIIYYLFYIISTRGPLAKVFTKAQVPEIVLILISLFFYNWAGVGEAWKLVIYIAAVYGMGWAIQFKRDYVKKPKDDYGYYESEPEPEPEPEPENLDPIEKRKREIKKRLAEEQKAQEKPKWWKQTDWIGLGIITLCAAIVVFILVYYKYADFITNLLTFNFSNKQASLVAPIGISFITFSAISYLVDIRRGDADCKNPIDCALYLCFFPKVISGPIVLWKDFKPQCGEKFLTLDKAFEGVERIMMGFAKKLIIADTLGACIAQTKGVAIGAGTAWGINFLFMLQIYFDFSGYSDIAIGLGKLLGYDMKENFNFPYLSTSIKDFWRRWHISLGTWFKEYVYIPLGGNRKSTGRTVLNLAVVFVLTGLWHGAGWTFLAWGALHGVFRILEKLMENSNFYDAIPSFIKWLFTMAILYFTWIIFRFTDFKELIDWFKVMFGAGDKNVPYKFLYYFDWRIIAFAVIGLFGSTILGLEGVKDACENKRDSSGAMFFRELLGILLFAVAIMFMVNSTYSPFMYFQF